MADVERLFEEYVELVRGGERPSPFDYIERAGPDAPRIALMIEAFSTPELPTAAGADDRVLARLEGAEAPFGARLAELRAPRSRAAIARELAAALGAPAQAAVVKGHLADLEHERLDPRRLAPEVVAALARVLGVATGSLESIRARTPIVSPARGQGLGFARSTAGEARAGHGAAPDPKRERIDELFLGPL
jgi:hypothetical protein